MKSAWSYNKSMMDVVDDLCQPLETYFDITHLAFLRFYNDGRLVRLANHTSWLNTFFEKEFFNDKVLFEEYIQPLRLFEEKVIFLTGTPKCEHAKLLISHNLWNFRVSFKRFPEYVESYCFATAIDNRDVFAYYMNNQETFDAFFAHFKEKALPLLQSNPHIYINTTLNIAHDPNKTSIKNVNTSFLQELYPTSNNIKLILSTPSLILSARQGELLFYISRGYSMKQIAQILQISPRTVETHVSHLKIKTKLKSKADLVVLGQKNHNSLAFFMKRLLQMKKKSSPLVAPS